MRWRKETALSLPDGCRLRPIHGLPGTWSLVRCCCRGPAFVELALAAGERVGLDTVEELTIEAPLVVPERGAVQLQLLVGALEEGQRRSLSVHGRAEGRRAGRRHASGVLSAAGGVPAQDLRVWPPAGAVAIELDGLYERVAEAGLDYSDAFCGLRAVYQRGRELFAEVDLPETASPEASRFGLHPALLDAALHAALATQAPGVEVALPFAWSGVQLQARGAAALRVRLWQARRTGAFLCCWRTPPASRWARCKRCIAGLRLPARSAARRRFAMRSTGWTGSRCRAPPPLPPHPSLIGHGWGVRRKACRRRRRATPILARCRRGFRRAIARPRWWCWRAWQAPRPRIRSSAAHAATQQLLGRLQGVLRDERLADSRVLVVTRRAVATHAGEDVLDLAHAPLWGLVRSAQSEHPGRLALLDIDTLAVSEPAWQGALGCEEPQLGLRQDKLCAPRLVRAGPDELLVPEGGAPWSLQISTRGSLDNLVLPHAAGRRCAFVGASAHRCSRCGAQLPRCSQHAWHVSR